MLGRSGRHEDALAIYVVVLNDLVEAEAYCERVINAPDASTDAKQVFLHLLLHSQLVHFLDPVGVEIKVTLLRWLLVHGLFIGGSAYVFLLVIDPFNLDGFRGLLLSLANATLGTNWQSIDRFFHVFWVKPIVQFEMRKKRNFCYLHSDIPR